MVVHFPIVLMIATKACTVLYLLTGIRSFEVTGWHCLGGGVLFTPWPWPRACLYRFQFSVFSFRFSVNKRKIVNRLHVKFVAFETEKGITWWFNYQARPVRPVVIKIILTPVLPAAGAGALVSGGGLTRNFWRA
jgi:hypothetical protein